MRGLILNFEDTGNRGWQTTPFPLFKLTKLRYRASFEEDPEQWRIYRINGGRGGWRDPTVFPEVPINQAGFCETTFVRFQEQTAYGLAWRHMDENERVNQTTLDCWRALDRPDNCG